MEQQQPNKLDAIKELYARGNLTFKLDVLQKDFYKLFNKTKEKIVVMVCARRLGKSYFAAVLAIEQCMKKPKSVVKILAPTRKLIGEIITPLFNEILEDCPKELRPTQVKNQYVYNFPNGSMIQFAGSDGGHADKLRGGSADICIIDEAAFCKDLENTIYSVLLPTTLTTRGKILLITTPPEDLDHDFMKFMESAEANGAFVKKTIFDNPRLKKQDIIDILAPYPGGLNNPRARREYLCELIKNDTRSVIPEFNDELEKHIIKEWPLPPFYESYVSMDLGYKDWTVVLFGYYDFRAHKVIIQDELTVEGKDLKLPILAQEILQKESSLWFNILTNEVKKPTLRISDINYIVTSELAQITNNELTFQIPQKDDKDAAINKLRVMLENRQIIIDPKCINLIRHLKNVKWKSNQNKTVFARSPDGSHYDLVDALIYMIRSINYNKNPYPVGYGLNPSDLFINNASYGQQTNNTIETFKRVFKNPARKSTIPPLFSKTSYKG